MGLFEVDVLNNDPSRYTVVALACVPFLVAICYMFKITMDNASGASKSMRALGYLIIALLWGFALIVSAFNFDSSALIVFGVISVLLVMICVYALCMSKHKSKKSVNVLIQFLVALGSLCAATSPSITDVYARMVVALTFVPVVLLSMIDHAN